MCSVKHTKILSKPLAFKAKDGRQRLSGGDRLRKLKEEMRMYLSIPGEHKGSSFIRGPKQTEDSMRRTHRV